MTEQQNLVRDISDTALWVAYFRARETQRPDGLFRDPYAEKLAGPKGYEIAAKERTAQPPVRVRVCTAAGCMSSGQGR